MTVAGIANILRPETIAMIVGSKTFERGEQCFRAGRVMGASAATGELCGLIKPQDGERPPYEVRIWVRDDGLAYQCTCPVGASQKFCKHTVAVVLAHQQNEHQRLEHELEARRTDLMNVGMAALLDGLVADARLDRALLDTLQRICEQAKR